MTSILGRNAAVALDSGATMTSVTRTILNDLVRVTIELDREVSFHDERIANPDRVFVDLPASRPRRGWSAA